ncbi:MAG: transposase [Candidatus Marinimicrobia bacterium]|nr:transposase [Candidatus Neomarinimicrobiota bacterium]
MLQVKDWQNCLLETAYVIVYFEAFHYKVRSYGKVQTLAVYICLGIDSHCYKESMKDLRKVNKTPTRIAAEDVLSQLENKIEKTIPRCN